MKITALSASCSFDPGFTVVAHVFGGAVELYTRGPDGQISTPERLPEHWQPWGTCASVAAAVAAGNLEPLRQAMRARGEAEQIRRGYDRGGAYAAARREYLARTFRTATPPAP